VFERRGITALVDKGGKKWQLDVYSQMLARTKQAQAHNAGLANRILENGIDLVKITTHANSCPLCRPWQGKVVSLTGATKGYPTLADAENDGGHIFKPNCRHSYDIFIKELQ